MIFDEKSHNYILSSGRKFHAYYGYLSVSMMAGGWIDHEPSAYVGNGDDNSIWVADDFNPQFAPEEVVEICNYAIDAWVRIKDKAQSGLVSDYWGWAKPNGLADKIDSTPNNTAHSSEPG